MLRAKWSILALVVLVGIGGCERQAYTEEAARQAIAEQQERFHEEIEKGVQAAPPVVVGETPVQDSAPTQGGSKASAPGDTGVAVPPPPASAPAGASSTPSPAATQPSTLGEARYNPETRQYGIQPPGAPDNYTVPLGQPQGK